MRGVNLMLSFCANRVLRVELDWGGFMTKKLAFTAEVSRSKSDCMTLPSRPMQRGTYELVAGLPFRNPHEKPFNEQQFRKVATTLVVR